MAGMRGEGPIDVARSLFGMDQPFQSPTLVLPLFKPGVAVQDWKPLP